MTEAAQVTELIDFGGIIGSERTLKAGYKVPKHVHDYDHVSYLVSGSVTVDRDGIEEYYEGPKMIEIKAGVNHEVMAHTDIVWLCLHAEALADRAEVLDRKAR